MCKAMNVNHSRRKLLLFSVATAGASLLGEVQAPAQTIPEPRRPKTIDEVQMGDWVRVDYQGDQKPYNDGPFLVGRVVRPSLLFLIARSGERFSFPMAQCSPAEPPIAEQAP
jgi:hypothetical protein